MASPTDDLDKFDRSHVFADVTVVRVSVRRTGDDSSPSGWRSTVHYGALEPGAAALDDGTIRRYDNAHEATNSTSPRIPIPGRSTSQE